MLRAVLSLLLGALPQAFRLLPYEVQPASYSTYPARRSGVRAAKRQAQRRRNRARSKR